MTENYITREDFRRLEDRIANFERILKGQGLYELDHAFRHDPSKLIAVKFEKEEEFLNYLNYLQRHNIERQVAGSKIVVLLKSDYELTLDAIKVPVKEMPVKRRRQLYGSNWPA